MALLDYDHFVPPSILAYLADVQALGLPSTLASAASTEFVLAIGGYTFTVTGTGFTYANQGGHVSPTGGTISVIALQIDGTPSLGEHVWTLSGLSLSVADFMAARQAEVASSNEWALDELFLGLGLDFTGDSAQNDTLAPDQRYDGQGVDLRGSDTISLLGGDDVYALSFGNDQGSGGDGNDTLYGEADHDSLYGDNGQDQLFGGDGSDMLEGGQRGDLLDGGKGADDLSGGRDADTLQGAKGSDQLNGGLGNDSLVSGAGADVILFLGDAGQDTVKGFDPLEDLLQIETTAVSFEVQGRGTLLTWSTGSALILGVTLESLDVGTNIDLI